MYLGLRVGAAHLKESQPGENFKHMSVVWGHEEMIFLLHNPVLQGHGAPEARLGEEERAERILRPVGPAGWQAFFLNPPAAGVKVLLESLQP